MTSHERSSQPDETPRFLKNLADARPAEFPLPHIEPVMDIEVSSRGIAMSLMDSFKGQRDAPKFKRKLPVHTFLDDDGKSIAIELRPHYDDMAWHALLEGEKPPVGYEDEVEVISWLEDKKYSLGSFGIMNPGNFRTPMIDKVYFYPPGHKDEGQSYRRPSEAHSAIFLSEESPAALQEVAQFLGVVSAYLDASAANEYRE